MPITNHWEEHGIYRKCSGSVNFKEYIETKMAIWDDSRFDQMKYHIFDALELELELEQTSVEEIVKAAHYDSASAKTNQQMAIAIVVDNPDYLQFAYLYMAESESLSKWKMEVFNTVEKARAWLSEQLDLCCEANVPADS